MVSEFERSKQEAARGLSWQTNTGLRARACYEQHCTLSSAGFITWIDMNWGDVEAPEQACPQTAHRQKLCPD